MLRIEFSRYYPRFPVVTDDSGLTFCSKCGKELTQDAAYCIHCGARVGEPLPFGRRREWGWERQRRHERPRDGWWGAVNAFGFLVIIGLTINQYPDVFSLINRYLESWGAHGYPLLPGHALGQIVIFFLTASGVWGLVSAGLRFAFTDSLSRPMRGVVGALFALYIANSFSQFYAGTIRGSGLVLDFFIGLAVVIIADAVIALSLPRWQRQLTGASG
jgi:hypothetical protein